MKKLLIAIFISIAFLGCGGGGGESSPESILEEATTANAFKAYDMLSTSTYLPSFLAKLRHVIANDGVDKMTNCNTSGSVNVTYQYTDTTKVPVYGENMDDIIGTYSFKQCVINLGDNEIYLDGNINQVRFMQGKTDLTLLSADISKGFIFRQKNPRQETDITYTDVSTESASTFLASNNQDYYADYYIASSFREKKLGDAYVKATIGRNVDGYYGDVISGIYYQGGSAEHINLIRWGTKYLMIANEEPRNKLLLLGTDTKTVEVWQDDAETVYAQTENTYDTSFTTYTPSF